MPIIVRIASTKNAMAKATIIPGLISNVTTCLLEILAKVILSAKCEKSSQKTFSFHLYQWTILLSVNGGGPAHL